METWPKFPLVITSEEINQLSKAKDVCCRAGPVNVNKGWRVLVTKWTPETVDWSNIEVLRAANFTATSNKELISF